MTNRKNKFRKHMVCMVSGLLLTGFGVLLSGCHITENGIPGNGNMVSRELTVSEPITEIEASMISATIYITAEQKDSISYTVDENLEGYLDIEATNGTLKIGSKNKQMLGRHHRITFHIGTDSLEKLDILGEFIVNGSGTLHSDRLRAHFTGAVKAELELDAQKVDVNIEGASHLILTGKTKELELASSGASKVRASHLVAQDATIQFGGASSIEVYAENHLDIQGAGAGSVTYWGNPVLSKSTAGFTSIKQGIPE